MRALKRADFKSLKPSLKTWSFLLGLSAPFVVNYVIFSFFLSLFEVKKFDYVGEIGSVFNV